MTQPLIITPDLSGHHNKDLEATNERMRKSGAYRDLSTIIISVTRGMIPATVVQSWMNLVKPMNQKVIGPIFIQGYEVGDGYEAAMDMILNNPELSQYKYLCSIEEDNLPPPDGLMKLYEAIEGEVDGVKYDCVGGLYWTKGPGGMPMCYGDPNVHPINFIPQMPQPETVTRCNGLGQGFNLYRMSMFTDGRIERPFFKTLQQWEPGVGMKAYTQDLRFFELAGKQGYKFACDARTRVGHWDQQAFMSW